MRESEREREREREGVRHTHAHTRHRESPVLCRPPPGGGGFSGGAPLQGGGGGGGGPQRRNHQQRRRRPQLRKSRRLFLLLATRTEGWGGQRIPRIGAGGACGALADDSDARAVQVGRRGAVWAQPGGPADAPEAWRRCAGGCGAPKEPAWLCAAVVSRRSAPGGGLRA